MAYENRTVQSSTANALPTGTDPAVDNTTIGDVQLIKLLNPTEGSVVPLIGQEARADSLPIALSTEDAALLDGLESALASILAKLIAAPATEAKQDAIVTALGSLATAANQGTANSALASVVSLLTTQAGYLDGVETALASILAKLIAAPATEAKQDTGNTSLSSIDGKTPALGQAVAGSSVPVVLPAAQITTLTPPAAITGYATSAKQDDAATLFGAVAETAPASDTASSGLNGRLQRIAQRLTTLITAIGSPFQAGGSIGNTAFGATQSGTWTVQPGNTANTTPWLVSPRPATSGGLSIYRNLDTGTGANIKSSAGQVFGWYVYNNAATTRYVKLYNASSAPTAGSGTPVITIPIPAGAAANVEFSHGIAFSSGIGITAVTGVADNNSGAPSSNDVIVNIFYA